MGAIRLTQEGGINTDLNDVGMLKAENAELRKEVVNVTKEKDEGFKIRDEKIKRRDEKITSLHQRLQRRNNNDDDNEDTDDTSSENENDDDDDNEIVDDGNKTVRKKEDELKAGEVRLQFALRMLALRWNAEIVGEEASIITAALIANFFWLPPHSRSCF